ncbi:V-type ATPase subunit [Pseudoflavonifractor phocaeensis]|nr:V-type ATPase subunit [Pseudoflavonifractor phocaeensis]
MENRLLTKNRMERMLEARTDEETAKVLSECGYGELTDLSPTAVDAAMVRARDALCRDLEQAVPDRRLVELFQIKYDYHNAKVLLKGAATGAKADRLLTGGGRYDPKKLAENVAAGTMEDYTPTFRAAVAEAAEVLKETGDPQKADIRLDRAWFEEMTATAKESRSAYLQGYVALMADAANLRTAVRAARMGLDETFVGKALVPGGTVKEEVFRTTKAAELDQALKNTPLAQAAALGAERAEPGSGSVTAFEKACDDAVTAYLAKAKGVPFGEAPVAGYLYARETERTAIRTILSGRAAGLSADTIRERLRDLYV